MDAKLITREYLLSLITTTTFSRRDTTTTCKLDIDGFPVKGEARCTFRQEFNQALGEKIAYDNALKALRELELYAARKNCKQ
ncbi:hypothetical protein D3C85_552620 [compost metagenome]